MTDCFLLLQKAPKFGNDEDYVDTIMNEVISQASDEGAKYRRFWRRADHHRDRRRSARYPRGSIDRGPADGRKAREPIAESGICAYQGRDRSGPTACMRSITKIDHLKLTSGDVVNMKFSPDALKDESKIRRFASLIRTYCETGGGLVQFNIVDGGTLRDAQKHPERYRDLLVRVATYSAYFVELPKEIQDNIIGRTEFQEV